MAEAGGMMYMDDGIEMETIFGDGSAQQKSGFMGALMGVPVVAASIVPYNTATAEQNKKMHQINAWIAAEAARDPRIEYADTRAATAAPGQPDKLAGSPDGLHPDVAGYRKMADAIETAILKWLK